MPVALHRRTFFGDLERAGAPPHRHSRSSFLLSARAASVNHAELQRLDAGWEPALPPRSEGRSRERTRRPMAPSSTGGGPGISQRVRRSGDSPRSPAPRLHPTRRARRERGRPPGPRPLPTATAAASDGQATRAASRARLQARGSPRAAPGSSIPRWSARGAPLVRRAFGVPANAGAWVPPPPPRGPPQRDRRRRDRGRVAAPTRAQPGRRGLDPGSREAKPSLERSGGLSQLQLSCILSR